MGRKKRKYKKRRKGQSLFGTSGAASEAKQGYLLTAKEGGLVLLSAIAAGGAGAAIGKHSFVAGLPVTLFGIHKKNMYITAAGLGLLLSNGFQKPGQPVTSTQGVEGFDIKQITQEAKDRVSTFFKNFGDKLYLPKAQGGTNGLGDDQVTYFVNPHSNKTLDMSAIDRIQEQIAEMNRGTSGLNEVEREF